MKKDDIKVVEGSLLDTAFEAFKNGKLSESAFNEIVSLHTKDG